MEMMNKLSEILSEFLTSLGLFAPLFSCLLIILEGILAFLPLFVFITINILVLGPLLGALLSWCFTVFGSFIAFYLCRRGLSDLFKRKTKDKDKINKFMNVIDNLKFTQLVLIVAIPFAPSFFINLGGGLSKIGIKKYLYALILGKIFVVIFWGYLGYNLIECLTNPLALIRVCLLLVGAYLIAKIINKKFNLDERF